MYFTISPVREFFLTGVVFVIFKTIIFLSLFDYITNLLSFIHYCLQQRFCRQKIPPDFQKYLTIFIDNERYPLHVSAHFIGIFLKSSFFGVCKFYFFISTFGLFLLQLLIWILRKYSLRQSFKKYPYRRLIFKKFFKKQNPRNRKWFTRVKG